MLYHFKWFELKDVRTFAQVKYVNKHVIHPLFLQMMEKVSMFDLILELLTIKHSKFWNDNCNLYNIK